MGCLWSSPRSKYFVGEERVTGMHPAASCTSSKTSARTPTGARPVAKLQEQVVLSAPPTDGNTAAPNSAPPAPAPKPARPKLDPKDYQFVGLRDVVRVKPPGSIKGQAFTIDNCEGCDLYVLDHCAAVTIDECRKCRIFIGPTAGSIFLRDSSDVKCAFITRQLRLRDVKSADIALLCRTQPIIEASSDVALTCYDLDYPALPAQLRGARLDALHNFWWHVYDFTPKPGNWRYLPGGISTEALLGGLPQEVVDVLKSNAAGSPFEQAAGGGLVPTWGEREPAPEGEYLLAVWPPNQADAARQFILDVHAKQEAVILTTNQVELNADALGSLAIKAGWAQGTQHKLGPPGACVGVEITAKPGVELKSRVQALGAQSTASSDAGAFFRRLGLEGM